MKLAGICFTKEGRKTALAVRKILAGYGVEKAEQKWYRKGRFPESGEPCDIFPYAKASLREWTGEHFAACDALIFIGAAGIAVRAIAPFVNDKRTDPAVLVIDERGTFCISLLSGHLGGANRLALAIAKELGSTPVITTATDVSRRFAADVFAAENHLTISDMTLAKEVSAALLAGENVGFWSAFPVEERLPEGLVMTQDLPLGICVGPSAKASRFAKTLHLIPKCLILGIGCRRGTDEETIEKFVKQNLRSAGLKMEAAAAVASIDLKKNEPGLVRFCEGHRLPFYTYTAEELKSAPGVFSPSAFVAKTTGVDNVCERAAVLAGAKELLLRKQAAHGVTLAAGLLPVDIRFHTSNLQGEQYEEY